MKKVDVFSRVLDSLGDEEKDKLLISAKGLMGAQKAVHVNTGKKMKSKKVKDTVYNQEEKYR